MSRKTLLIDCDGVLYPENQLGLAVILTAMKNTYRDDLQLTGAEQAEISDKTLSEKHLGAFNYIREICNYKKYDFGLFCRKMAQKTDYSRIKPNPLLWQSLRSAMRLYDVAILSNNSRPHIDNVLQRVFEKTASEAEVAGIKICDITFTERDGYFLPKQSENGLSFVAEKLKVNPNECTLLDDSSVNIKAARRQGMNGVLINSENTAEKYLKSICSLPFEKGKGYE